MLKFGGDGLIAFNLSGKSVLILAYKNIASTPRVLKELLWLQSLGAIVDTAGFGKKPSGARDHFQFRPVKAMERYLSYLFRSSEGRFVDLVSSRIPGDLGERLKGYDLLIIHEPTFFPWKALSQEIDRRDGRGIHVDFHEDHTSSLSRTPLERLIFEKYRDWEFARTKEVLGGATFASVSSCSKSISHRFALELGREVAVLRNSASFQELNAVAPEEGKLSLVHHGVGTRDRGIETYIRTMKYLGPEFHLHLYLVMGLPYKLKINLLAFVLGVKSRVSVHNPVPTRHIAATIAKHDVALIVIPPVTENERLALPNKLFESIQARLALVVGPNPDIAEVVNLHGLGVVLDSWKSRDLARALRALTHSRVIWHKNNANEASGAMSAEVDEVIFRSTISQHFRG